MGGDAVGLDERGGMSGVVDMYEELFLLLLFISARYIERKKRRVGGANSVSLSLSISISVAILQPTTGGVGCNIF